MVSESQSYSTWPGKVRSKHEPRLQTVNLWETDQKSRIPEFVKKKKYKKGKFSILNEQVKKIKDLFPISNQIYKHKHKETLDKKPNLSEKTNSFWLIVFHQVTRNWWRVKELHEKKTNESLDL